MSEIRPRDIAALPRDTSEDHITALLTASYDSFCLCVVAEATRRHVPPALRSVLRQPEWLDDWTDALHGIEGNLQVASMRARFEDGLDSTRALTNASALKAVRARIHETRILAKAPKGAPPPELTDEARATRALTRRYREEYRSLIDDEVTFRGVSPVATEVARDACVEFNQWEAADVLPFVAPVTASIAALRRLPDDAFRRVVAMDVQDDPECPDLSHPILLHRWGVALAELARTTAELLDIPARPLAEVTDADLAVAGMDGDAVYRRINQFRFLVHVRQRWMEQRALRRRFRRDVQVWRESVVVPAQAAARARLRDIYREDYDLFLAEAEQDSPERPTPSPPPPPVERSAVPAALQAFRAQAGSLGWTTFVTEGDGRARVDIRRGGTGLRVAWKRRENTGGGGWSLVFVGASTRAIGRWVRLPNVGVALDLAALADDEFEAQVRRYQEAAPREAAPFRVPARR